MAWALPVPGTASLLTLTMWDCLQQTGILTNRMAVYGSLGAFEDGVENFADYCGRCDAFMAADDIQDGRKVNLFLATIGPSTYKLLM